MPALVSAFPSSVRKEALLIVTKGNVGVLLIVKSSTSKTSKVVFVSDR